VIRGEAVGGAPRSAPRPRRRLAGDGVTQKGDA